MLYSLINKEKLSASPLSQQWSPPSGCLMGFFRRRLGFFMQSVLPWNPYNFWKWSGGIEDSLTWFYERRKQNEEAIFFMLRVCSSTMFGGNRAGQYHQWRF
jgi:hypothetical protein